MPTYTTSAKVNIHLPASVPTAISDLVDDDIADASDIVDSKVGSRFGLDYKTNTQKFPDIGDATPTPAIIEKCARYLAAATQLDRIGDQVKEGKVSRAMRLEKKALDLLDSINAGKTEVIIGDASIGASNLAGVEDEIYENSASEPVFNTDDINKHLRH